MGIVEIKQLVRTFGTGTSKTKALGPISFTINKGEFVVITGRSGSGKSTLLNLLCGLDLATSGTLTINKKNLSNLNQTQLAEYRSTIGIIFQSYNLLPNLNTLENVLLGAWAGGQEATKSDALAILKKVNLGHRSTADVKNLSGGERQRVSIARSLIRDPDILFCDEPTGALDSHNEEVIIKILRDLNKEGKTIVMVTHNTDFAKYADTIIHLEDGLIVKNPTLTSPKITTKKVSKKIK
jgi:ABC-type lipoprotein export system ATPase subunit